jgi:hypothetical protein
MRHHAAGHHGSARPIGATTPCTPRAAAFIISIIVINPGLLLSIPWHFIHPKIIII